MNVLLIAGVLVNLVHINAVPLLNTTTEVERESQVYEIQGLFSFLDSKVKCLEGGKRENYSINDDELNIKEEISEFSTGPDDGDGPIHNETERQLVEVLVSGNATTRDYLTENEFDKIYFVPIHDNLNNFIQEQNNSLSNFETKIPFKIINYKIVQTNNGSGNEAVSKENGSYEYGAIGGADFETYLSRENFVVMRDERWIDYENMSAITVQEGVCLSLNCNVTGIESYKVDWRKYTNSKVSEIQSMDTRLTIEEVDKEHGGVYGCTVSVRPPGMNATLNVTNFMHVNVQYLPDTHISTHIHHYGRSMVVNAACHSFGNPPPDTSWYFNGTKSLNGSVGCYSNLDVTIYNYKNSSHETYSEILFDPEQLLGPFGVLLHCRSSNSVGTSRKAIYFTFSSLPNLKALKAEYNTFSSPEPSFSKAHHFSKQTTPQTAVFFLGMIPPIYIGLYIITYVGCYKTSVTSGGKFWNFKIMSDGEEW